MRAITERLIVGLTAAAERECLSTGKVILFTFAVIELNVAFNSERAIVFGGDLDRHRLLTFL